MPAESSFVVFDTRAIPDDYTGAAMFAICGYITAAIEARRERHLSGDTPQGGGWDGKAFLVLDELWRLMRHRRTGAWVEEFARRSGIWRCA